ncbi:hypothetical protein BH11PSE3_BH11PSE3_16370 [soil metagenome]
MSGSAPRRVALVAGHFPPSNLAAVHRARLWSQYLPDFNWTPIVVTTDPRYYEEELDPDIEMLVPRDLRVIRTRALPTRPLRVIGDIGVRGFWWHYRALCKLAEAGEIDFIHITIPSHFSAPLGRLVFRRYGIPYGIDYIDPWVNRWPGVDKLFSRAWGSYQLAHILEPWSVKDAALITGVAAGYYQGMLERNPEVARRVVTAAMPYGGSARDFDFVRQTPRPIFLWDKDDGLFHMIYAGALLPAGIVIMEAFFRGLAQLRDTAPETARRIRVHFVGTGRSPNDKQGHQVLPIAARCGVEDMVTEHPHRIGYVDTLNHLTHADAVVVLGSTEPHYTPSKIFQGALSRRPVLAVLHEASTAVGMVRAARAGRVIAFADGTLPDVGEICRTIAAVVTGDDFDPQAVDWSIFDDQSARRSAQLLAEAMDLALARSAARSQARSQDRPLR